jgi:hypothetical protein
MPDACPGRRDVSRCARSGRGAVSQGKEKVYGSVSVAQSVVVGGVALVLKSVSSVFDLPRLHSSHSACRLLMSLVPPLERGMM